MQPITPKTAGEARTHAIKWQAWQSEQKLTYGEILEWQKHFATLAKLFPELEDEFIENSLI